MKEDKELKEDEPDRGLEEGETIDRGLEQMEMLYKSRCIQPPTGSNVTVREIIKHE